MDHSEALQLMATERYLLDEFPPEMKEQFEEHYFGCPECALDVRMAAAFVEQSRKELSVPAALPVAKVPVKSGPPAWLRPIFAVPAFAMLLAIIGYQALVIRPEMSKTIADLRQPGVLASAYLSRGTARGDGRPVVTATAGQPFVLFVDIPADIRFAAYSAELLSPAGKKVWTLTIPAEVVESAKDSLPIRVAPAGNESGEYVLMVRGMATGASKGPEIARYLFELQLR